MSTETNEFPDEEITRQAEHPTALLGRYALGALDPDEVELVARHVQSCSTCRAELAEYDQVVGLLPYAAPVHQVPVRARAKLLAKIDEIGTENIDQIVVLPPIPQVTLPPQPKRFLPVSPRVVAFASVPLVLIFAIVGIMANVINDQQAQIATIEAEQAAVDKVLLGDDGSEEPAQATFISSNSAHGARAKLIVNHETNSALILARDLPVVDGGQSYIAWLRMETPDEYARAGVLVVGQDGRASLSVEPPDDIANYLEVVVTIESDAEVTTPTGPQIMTAAVMPDN